MFLSLGLGSMFGILEGVLNPLHKQKIVPLRKEIMTGQFMLSWMNSSSFLVCRQFVFYFFYLVSIAFCSFIMKANFLGVKNVISRVSFLNVTPLGSVGKSHVSCDETSLQDIESQLEITLFTSASCTRLRSHF